MKQGITSGFFNAKNSDRRYDAYEMSSLFSGIIRDGVFMDYKDGMLVTAKGAGDMTVHVHPGKCWFNGLWTEVHEVMPLVCDTADVLYNRIDSVILRVDTTESERENSIYIKKGTPGSNPQAPALERTAFVYEVRLANITVHKNTRAITAANTACLIGTSNAPWSTGILDCIDVDHLYTVWQAWFEEWRRDEIAKWNAWLDGREGEWDGFLQARESEYDAMAQRMGTEFTNLKNSFDNQFNDLKTLHDGKLDKLWTDHDALLEGLMIDINDWWNALKGEFNTSAVQDAVTRAEAAADRAEAIKNELSGYTELDTRLKYTEYKHAMLTEASSKVFRAAFTVNGPFSINGEGVLYHYDHGYGAKNTATVIRFGFVFRWSTSTGQIDTADFTQDCGPELRITWGFNVDNKLSICIGFDSDVLSQYDTCELRMARDVHTSQLYWDFMQYVGYIDDDSSDGKEGGYFTRSTEESWEKNGNFSSGRYAIFSLPGLNVNSWMQEHIHYSIVSAGVYSVKGVVSWRGSNGSISHALNAVDDADDVNANQTQAFLLKRKKDGRLCIGFYYYSSHSNTCIIAERRDFHGNKKTILLDTIGSSDLPVADYEMAYDAGLENETGVSGVNIKKSCRVQRTILTGTTVPSSANPGDVFFKWK